MVILGIDPGGMGGLAILDGDTLKTFPMPVYEITKGRSKRKRIDIGKLIETIKYHWPDHVVIEHVSAQPGNGAAHAFTYGFGCGVIEAVMQTLGVPFTYVTPKKWKKDMQCPRDKDGARMRASQLLPAYAHCWQLKKQDGIAEAALIALWYRNNHN